MKRWTIEQLEAAAWFLDIEAEDDERMGAELDGLPNATGDLRREKARKKRQIAAKLSAEADAIRFATKLPERLRT